MSEHAPGMTVCSRYLLWIELRYADGATIRRRCPACRRASTPVELELGTAPDPTDTPDKEGRP